MSPAVLFDALGPLEVRRLGKPVALGPPQRRLLLLRLLVAERAPVARDVMLDELWGGRPPTGGVSSLHAHISRLRALLPDGPPIVRDGAGYALLAEPAMLTTVRFERAVDRARTLFAAGHAAVARTRLEPALKTWRGRAYAEAATFPFARAAAARLEECRAAAAELHVAILLAAGDFTAATIAARDLTVTHPLRESAWELLMRALYQAGRPAEALAQYGRLRTRLIDELGAEPGPALRRLHLAILRQDPALDAVPEPAPFLGGRPSRLIAPAV
ncbi:AfsR/SARP family transcriptional regulator [Actinoplanes sp. HUAS TT8]|uniref:AfsR/SARP family transcriptional regulator n=1 Tax=Actinoplanes sp. HUAS TT8 TaxID=3447453 RepID=UPI003F51BEBA